MLEENKSLAQKGKSGGIQDGIESSAEKVEEAKLKAKYPAMNMRGGGHSQFLQRRLQHRQKFFDSGDYNVAKSKAGLKLSALQQTGGGAGAGGGLVGGSKMTSPAGGSGGTSPGSGGVGVTAVRDKAASVAASGVFAGQLKIVVDSVADGSTSPTGCEIPRPETVPARKMSIIAPEVASKLSPQPLIHHHHHHQHHSPVHTTHPSTATAVPPATAVAAGGGSTLPTTLE
jgi:hypothetical protein